MFSNEADSIADFAVGLLLSLDRSAVERELKRNHAKWRRDVSTSPPYHALGLMKVGIMGFGEVGRKVAERLRPFGCEIKVYDPETDAETLSAEGCEPAELDEIFRVCDAVTVHMSLPAGEKPIIGRKQFALMRPTSWFINVTQAEIVDEEALIEAVLNKIIAGAALDVFHHEPLPENYPLIGIPDVILTPHIAGSAAE